MSYCQGCAEKDKRIGELEDDIQLITAPEEAVGRVVLDLKSSLKDAREAARAWAKHNQCDKPCEIYHDLTCEKCGHSHKKRCPKAEKNYSQADLFAAVTALDGLDGDGVETLTDIPTREDIDEARESIGIAGADQPMTVLECVQALKASLKDARDALGKAMGLLGCLYDHGDSGMQAEIDDLCASNVVRCTVCGCKGNSSCGHEPLDPDKCCTLDACLVCPCCQTNKLAALEGKK